MLNNFTYKYINKIQGVVFVKMVAHWLSQEKGAVSKGRF